MKCIIKIMNMSTNELVIYAIGGGVSLIISLIILRSHKVKSFYAFLTPLFPGIIMLIWGFSDCDDMGCGIWVFVVLAFLFLASIVNSFAVVAYLLFNKYYHNKKSKRALFYVFMLGVLISVLGLYAFTYIRDRVF